MTATIPSARWLALGVVLAVAAGAATALSPVAGASVAVLVLLGVVVLRFHGSAGMARVFLWLAALGPFLATTEKTQQDVVTQQIATLDILRALVPLVSLAVALLLRRPVRRGIHMVDWLLVAYLAFLGVSTVWSIGPSQTLMKALLLSVTFLALGLLVRTYETLEDALRGLSVFVHVLLWAECLQILIIPSQAYYADTDLVPRLRSVVPTIADNPLAYVAVLGLLQLVVGIGPAWTLRMPTRALLFLAYAGILLGTRTRTSVLLAVLLLVFALAMVARERVGALLLLMVGSTVGIMVATLMSSTVASYLLRGQNAENVSTLTGRTPVWNQAVAYWSEAPWLGHGFYAGHRLGLPPLPGTVAHSNLDNTWLETLVDVGLVGTLLLSLFVLLGVLGVFRCLRGAEASTRILVVATLAYGFVVSFVNPSLQMNGVAQIFLGFVILAGAARLPTRHRLVSAPTAAPAPALPAFAGSL